MKFYDFEVRISYSETDRMGVIYYANYLVFFERGRTEFLRALGKRYRNLEEQDGIFLPVTEARVEYFHPGRYDDLIKVRTFVAKLGGASIGFRHEISLVDTRQLIAIGTTHHAVVNRAWQPIRIPTAFRSLLSPHLEKNVTN